MMKVKIVLGAVALFAIASCASKQAATDQPPVSDSSQVLADTPQTSVDTMSKQGAMVDTSGVSDSSARKTDSNIKDVVSKSEKISYMGEQAIIYKTKKDYSKFVPVTLNDDKTKIVSYPAPKDVFHNGKLAYPEKLKDDFLLDNRGINQNSAFLNLSYEEYSKLNEAPLLKDMMGMISDKDPVTEIYSLGNRSRFKDEVKEINDIIERGALKKFKKIK